MAGLSGFSYYKEITISNTNVDSDLGNFPVYIPIVADADIGAVCRADGYDVQFANADNSESLVFERLPGFAVATGEASGGFYVLVPSVTAASAVVIRCYYGNAGATDVSSPTGTFDTANGWAAVWHLEEDGNPYYDATTNDNDSTAGAYPDRIAGKTGYGQDFEDTDNGGDGELISFPDSAFLDLGTGDFTISLWIKPETVPTAILCTKGFPAEPYFYVLLQGNGVLQFYMIDGSSNACERSSAASAIAAGNWYHLYLTVDRDSATGFKAAINGSALSDANPTSVGTLNNEATLCLGEYAAGGYPFDGIIDEVRVSATFRGADWGKFEYYNSHDGHGAGNELGWGEETAVGGGVTIEVDPGSYAWAGLDAVRKYEMVASPKAYATSGTSAESLTNRTLAAGVEAYAVSGEDVTLTKPTGFTLDAEAGTYAVTGEAAGLIRAVLAELGTYATAGEDIALLLGGNYVLSIDPGTYAVAGEAVNTVADRIIRADNEAVEDQTGSTYNYGDFTPDNSFFWSSLDLSAFAGTDVGSTPYYIELVDGTGKKATGFIGAVGAGETLGSELLTNGGFDSDTTGWTGQRATLASVAGGQSGNCLEITDTEYLPNAYQDIPGLSTGSLYKGSAYVKAGTGPQWFYEFRERFFGTVFFGGTLSASWVLNSGYAHIVDVDNCSINCLGPSGLGLTSLFDETTFKQVTDPPATAVHIVSAYNGSTRAWGNIESGFNPNTITTWAIYEVDTIGSYTSAGEAAGTLKGYLIEVSPSLYAIAGADAGTLATRILGVGDGAYTSTGQSADLLRGMKLIVEDGAYVLTGEGIDFPGSKTIAADAGAYATAGAQTILALGRVMRADAGGYTLSGAAAGALKAAILTSEVGSYALAGGAIGALCSRLLAADADAYALTGQDLDLLKAFGITVEAGGYVLTGATVDVYWEPTFVSPIIIRVDGRKFIHDIDKRVKVVRLEPSKRILDVEKRR